MSRQHVPPSIQKSAFNCPRCDAFAKQDWHQSLANFVPGKELPTQLAESCCRHSTLDDGNPLPPPDEELDAGAIERFPDSQSQIEWFDEISPESGGHGQAVAGPPRADQLRQGWAHGGAAQGHVIEDVDRRGRRTPRVRSLRPRLWNQSRRRQLPRLRGTLRWDGEAC